MTVRAIDLFAGHPDPYLLYEELREQHDGVHFVEDMWLLFRYPDVQRLTTERTRWSSAYFDDMPVGIYTAGDPALDRLATIEHGGDPVPRTGLISFQQHGHSESPVTVKA